MYATAFMKDSAPSFNVGSSQAKDFDPTGWELALVTTPSTNISANTERQLVGFFYLYL